MKASTGERASNPPLDPHIYRRSLISSQDAPHERHRGGKRDHGALRERSPRTVDEIIAEVGPRRSWGEATIKTLINRLLKKKATKSEPIEGRRRSL